MIEELRISDLGVIADTTLELAAGLTVLTGETGAGKTMVVTALGLLLGARADTAVIRTGADVAVVEGVLRVRPDGVVADRAVEAGAVLEEDRLLVARTVSAAGRGRAHAGGRSVPVTVLGELVGEQVTVHGQSEQLRLRSGAEQRRILDGYAGEHVASVLRLYRQAWHVSEEARRRAEEVASGARQRTQEAELLRLGLAEVDRIDPLPQEDVALAEEWARLAHAEELRQGAQQAKEAVAGTEDQDGPGAQVLLAEARAALEGVRGHDPRVGELADRLAELTYLLADLGSDLAGYAADVDADPARLADVESRRSAVGVLVRAHGDVDTALAWAERSRERLLELDDDGLPERLRQEAAAARERLVARAAALHEARREAAVRLATAVTAELTSLALPRARLLVQVRPVDPGPDGADEVEVLLAAHSGAQPRPVSRAASGGELSRVMLAIEVVTASGDPEGTYVFDEVDAGVGGAAAVEVGRRLAVLSATSQVVVVTHLPQVAAFADQHLVVTKRDDGTDTVSAVRAVDGAERVREVARMLAGLTSSDTAAAHATELLEAAAAMRAEDRAPARLAGR